MKPLPQRLPMRALLFTDGARGSASQTHRSDEHGITVVAARKDRNSPFVESWTADRLPGQIFGSYRDLRAAIELAGV